MRRRKLRYRDVPLRLFAWSEAGHRRRRSGVPSGARVPNECSERAGGAVLRGWWRVHIFASSTYRVRSRNLRGVINEQAPHNRVAPAYLAVPHRSHRHGCARTRENRLPPRSPSLAQSSADARDLAFRCDRLSHRAASPEFSTRRASRVASSVRRHTSHSPAAVRSPGVCASYRNDRDVGVCCRRRARSPFAIRRECARCRALDRAWVRDRTSQPQSRRCCVTHRAIPFWRRRATSMLRTAAGETQTFRGAGAGARVRIRSSLDASALRVDESRSTSRARRVVRASHRRRFHRYLDRHGSIDACDQHVDRRVDAITCARWMHASSRAARTEKSQLELYGWISCVIDCSRVETIALVKSSLLGSSSNDSEIGGTEAPLSIDAPLVLT